MNVFYRAFIVIKVLLLYKWKFRKICWKAVILSPLRIDGACRIELGHSTIGYKCWIAANPLTGSDQCTLIINDGCSIGNFNHIYSTRKIVIEENVLIADRVYISDNLHEYENIDMPVKEQSIKQLDSVTIGKDSWIGENVCVIGASIGKHSVIGANSVVTHSIPDYSVAVGVPAKVVKKYDFNKKQWIKV